MIGRIQSLATRCKSQSSRIAAASTNTSSVLSALPLPTLASVNAFSTLTSDDDEEDKSNSKPNNVTKVDELLVEDIPTEGEWAGCSKRFMAPLRVPVRGGGES